MTTADVLLTTDEAAAVLRLDARFVRDELTRKNLRGIKVGGQWRVYESDLRAYLAAKANVRPVRGRS